MPIVRGFFYPFNIEQMAKCLYNGSCDARISKLYVNAEDLLIHNRIHSCLLNAPV
jgi:hypothetical protein